MNRDIVVKAMSWCLPAALIAGISGSRDLRAAIITIDDFATPAPASVFLIEVNHPNAVPVEQGGLANTTGAERDVLVAVQGIPSVQSAQLLIGYDEGLFETGVLQLATARDPGTMVTLQYDGDDVDGDTLVNSRGLMLDLTDGGLNTDLLVEFLSVDAPGAPGLDMRIRLTSSAGGTAVFDDIVPESAGPISALAPYAEFMTAGEFSFVDVDSIEIDFNHTAVMDVDFEIVGITAVPEPSGGALLLLGMLAAGMLIRRHA